MADGSDPPPDDAPETPSSRERALRREIRRRQQAAAEDAAARVERLAERTQDDSTAFRARAADQVEEALSDLYGSERGGPSALEDVILEATGAEWEATLVAEARAAAYDLTDRIAEVRAAGDVAFADLLEFSRQAPAVRLRLARRLDDTRRWIDPRGYQLSDRIWDAREGMRERINQDLRRALARGDGPRSASRLLRDYLTPQDEAGVLAGRGRGTHAANRLATTELARARAEATVAAATAIPTARGVRWTLSNNHPRVDVCDQHARTDRYGLGPGGYPVVQRPRLPAHPFCRCRWATILPTRSESDAFLRRKYGLDGLTDADRSRMGGGDRSSDAIANEIRAMGPMEARSIGMVPEAASRHWRPPTRVTRMTTTARDHFLKRPMMEDYYPDIINTVRDPEEVHTYPGNPRRASFFRRVDPTHQIHVAIDMTESPDRDNEVVTAIYMRDKELARKRRQGLMVWQKGDEG